jgi:hypothetical protein
VGDDSNFLIYQKLLGEDGSVRRSIVMVKQPGLFSPVPSSEPISMPITNSRLLSNVMNGPVSMLMDELLNSCNSFRSCAACGSPCVFVIVSRCATSLEPGMPLKYQLKTQDLVPEGL